ncbi:MAG TPA: hypothetical protein VNN79_24360 [Actinomycetota bacterium]|nr:hypothetical protein [Actinomycetota bacterium]
MAFARTRRIQLAVLAAVVLAVTGSGLATTPAGATTGRSNPGDLDPTFANQGVFDKPLGAPAAFNGIVRLSTGKLVAAGYKGDDLLLARFTAGGHLDHAFDGDGLLTMSRPNRELGAGAMSVHDDRIVVAGGIETGSDSTTLDVYVARFLADGQPDPTFGGGDGFVETDAFGSSDSFEDMAVGSDGKPVVAVMSDVNGNQRAGVLRYTAAGKLDTTFSGDGKFLLPNGGKPFIEAVTVLPSLEIVAGGQANFGSTFDFGLYGVKPSGATDPSFGTFGVATTDFDDNGDVVDALAVDRRGRILAAGTAFVNQMNEYALARYTSNGQPDAAFSGDGKLAFSLGDSTDRVFALAFQGKRILAGGRGDLNDNERWSLVRIRAGGILDSSFGTGGVVFHDFAPGPAKFEENSGLAFEPGRIVGCGYAANHAALVGWVA